MNTSEQQTPTDGGDQPPLHEDNSREDPANRPEPTEDEGSRQHHVIPTEPLAEPDYDLCPEGNTPGAGNIYAMERFLDRTQFKELVGTPSLETFLFGPHVTPAETEAATFTFQEHIYRSSDLQKLVDCIPVTQFPLEKLQWMAGLPFDQALVDAADLSLPVVVTEHEMGSWTAPDGLPRVIKALQQKAVTLPAKVVPPGFELSLHPVKPGNEGVFDFFKKLFQPSPKAHDANAVKVLESQYKNLTWLNQQSFAEGEIDLGKAGKALAIKGKVPADIQTAVTLALKEFGDASRDLVKALKPILGEVDERLDDVYDSSSAEWEMDQIADLVDEANTLIRNATAAFTLGDDKVTSTTTKALDAKGVQQLATGLLKLIALYETTRQQLGNLGVAEAEWQMADILTEYPDQTLAESSFAGFRILDELEEVIRVLTIAIDKSIKATGGTPSTVSKEGFGDFIKGLFTKKPVEVDFRNLTEVRRKLKETLLSDKWLAQQGFITDDVTLVVPAFLVTGDYSSVVRIMENSAKGAIAKNKAALQTWYATWERINKYATSGDMNSWTVAGVRDMIDSVDTDADIDFVDMPDLMKGPRSVKLPALNAAQVKAVAEVILALNDSDVGFFRKSVEGQWRDDNFLGKGDISKWDQNSAFSKERLATIKDPAVKAAVDELFETCEHACNNVFKGFFNGMDVYWHNHHHTATLLVAWIEKSLGKTVSKEVYVK
jgi:hypothetical protein